MPVVQVHPRAAPASPARPFLKWVGGKRQLLAELREAMPRRLAGTYYEPFVGGGALFFATRPGQAVLADKNERLIRAYRGIRDHVGEVVRLLGTYPHDKEFYLALRRHPIDAGSDVEVAAWLVYLNKTGYNGLYRVNSRNEVNVPFGRYARPTICDEANLRACAEALRGVELSVADFERVVCNARKGDFVYFDPPYVPASATARFTAYTAGGFSLDDHARLRDVALGLKKRGVRVLLSNSSEPEVRALYAKGFALTLVQATRAVNADASRRGKVSELLIR